MLDCQQIIKFDKGFDKKQGEGSNKRMLRGGKVVEYIEHDHQIAAKSSAASLPEDRLRASSMFMEDPSLITRELSSSLVQRYEQLNDQFQLYTKQGISFEENENQVNVSWYGQESQSSMMDRSIDKEYFPQSQNVVSEKGLKITLNQPNLLQKLVRKGKEQLNMNY